MTSCESGIRASSSSLWTSRKPGTSPAANLVAQSSHAHVVLFRRKCSTVCTEHLKLGPRQVCVLLFAVLKMHQAQCRRRKY
jgi:hypothetical protein